MHTEIPYGKDTIVGLKTNPISSAESSTEPALQPKTTTIIEVDNVKYEVQLEPLAKGGQGSIHLAWILDKKNERFMTVAIKINNPAKTPTDQEKIREKTIAEYQESTTTALSNPGKTVTPLGYIGETSSPLITNHAIVMELMTNKQTTAYDMIQQLLPSRLNPDACLKIAEQLATVVDERARSGVLLIDTKPTNYFIHLDTLAVKISDFGLTAKLHSIPTTIAGTPLYMTPEQIGMKMLTQQTLVYQMAANVYFLMSSHDLFGLTNAFARMPKMYPDQLQSHLPEENLKILNSILMSWGYTAVQANNFCTVMTIGLAVLPSKRYNTCQNFVIALKTALQPRSHLLLPNDPRLSLKTDADEQTTPQLDQQLIGKII